MPKQTFQISTTAAESDNLSLPGVGGILIPVTVAVAGCDALVDFGTEPNADNGGVIPAGSIFKTMTLHGDKASFKAISGSGWITFYYGI